MNRSAERHGGRRDAEARARLAPHVNAGRAVCARCGRLILPGESWDAGHVDDLASGGDPGGARRPEHTACNRSAGARLGQQLRRSARIRLDEWLR